MSQLSTDIFFFMYVVVVRLLKVIPSLMHGTIAFSSLRMSVMYMLVLTLKTQRWTPTCGPTDWKNTLVLPAQIPKKTARRPARDTYLMCTPFPVRHTCDVCAHHSRCGIHAMYVRTTSGAGYMRCISQVDVSNTFERISLAYCDCMQNPIASD
jgi:hypothetical protein